MPPRFRLPRLTLFTGGKECSLCETFKEKLNIVKKTHPFDITYWHIREPPAGTPAKLAKEFRRKYQYDIPVLHLEDKRIQWHFCDEPALKNTLEAWYKENPEPSEEKREMTEQKISRGSWSGGTLDDFFDDNGNNDNNDHMDNNEQIRKRGKLGSATQHAPWNGPMGRGFFALSDHTADPGPGEEDLYLEILKRTFQNFSQEVIGVEAERQALNKEEEEDDAWEIDLEARRGTVDGDREITYDTVLPMEAAQPTPKPVRFDRSCWNCGDDTHRIADCLLPRNPERIQSARLAYWRQKEIDESTMPAHHRPYLSHYTCTQEDRQRRLDLVEEFEPGRPSRELLDAVFYVERYETDGYEEDEEYLAEKKKMEEELIWAKVRRRRGEMPWFGAIMTWGYPPGWIAERDPMGEAARRIRIDPLVEGEDSDDEDDLVVFGGSDLNPPTSDSPPALPPPPPPEGSPPPPPTTNRPYRRWWELRPPKPIGGTRGEYHCRPKRWAKYDTDIFSSDRLQAYDPVRPMPLQVSMRFDRR